MQSTVSISTSTHYMYANLLLSKTFLLANLSRRLIDELIVYLCSGILPSSSSSQCSSIFFSKTAWTTKAKLCVEPLWVGGKKVCSRHLGHIAKMTATPIYCKTLKNLLRNRLTDFHETWYIASGLQPIIVCSNDDPGLILTYFAARPNLVS